MINPNKEKWSVWMAHIRFEDGTGIKERPVIVLNDRIILCVCMGVTSKTKSWRHGYKLKYWGYAGLSRESWVRFEYLEVKPDKFKRRLGILHQEDIAGIEKWMKNLTYGHDL